MVLYESKNNQVMNKYLILSSFLALSFLVTGSVSAAEAGDVISCPNTTSAYYVSSDGDRWVFPDQQTYYSWYIDTSNIMEVPCSELGSYAIGGNITIQPGTWLIKNQSSPEVFAIEPGGILRWIQNEDDAAWLYGNSWKNRIRVISDTQWPHYRMGETLATKEIPVGTIIFELNRPGEVESEFLYYADRAYNVTSKIDEVLNNNPSKVLKIEQDPILVLPDNIWSNAKNLTWRR